MMNYYVYLALARGRSDALLREAEAARRARAGAAVPAAGRRIRRPQITAPPALPPAAARLDRLDRPGPAGLAVRRAGASCCATGRRWSSGRSSRDDAPLLADGFARLGPESRRLRFLRRKDELSAAELRYFTDVDHHDHEALGALDHADGRGVGVARYVRDAERPAAAEIAVTVVDDWQGRGLGTELLAQLSGRARAAGIRRFTALVSADNAAMAALLRSVCAEPRAPRARHRGIGDHAGAQRGALRRPAGLASRMRHPGRARGRRRGYRPARGARRR